MKLTKSFIKQVIMEEMQAMQEAGMTADQILAEVEDLKKEIAQAEQSRDYSVALAQAEEVVTHLRQRVPEHPEGEAAGVRSPTWVDRIKGRTVANVD